jgi:hypothetical protein
MEGSEIVTIIKQRRDEWWDRMQVGPDPNLDLSTASAIVNEYDELLTEIGANKTEERKTT